MQPQRRDVDRGEALKNGDEDFALREHQAIPELPSPRALQDRVYGQDRLLGACHAPARGKEGRRAALAEIVTGTIEVGIFMVIVVDTTMISLVIITNSS